ncbi:Protein-tyrosine-phosphatase [Variovorax sp. OK605]|uniref:arsenate reductase ArsC n=1 Tax=Variovorax sp. OK605 TaxID=1855317 RepID=UPI0008EC3310|nr:arsenate reductase ArsC [Variovorax sp. OK605]SFQ74464.1 Protein-tyrosine-phosphatase [Variovorax sp. OK605]
MPERTYHVLFTSTANSARSILAEGLLNHMGKGRFKAYSAGSRPLGEVNADALDTLDKMHVPITDYRSKNWDEFAKPDAPAMDFVLSVCDKAADEVCPVWPGQPITAHWGVVDPAAFETSKEAVGRCFMDTALTLKRRIELMLVLPLYRLDAMVIQRVIRDIGEVEKAPP